MFVAICSVRSREVLVDLPSLSLYIVFFSANNYLALSTDMLCGFSEYWLAIIATKSCSLAAASMDPVRLRPPKA